MCVNVFVIMIRPYLPYCDLDYMCGEDSDFVSVFPWIVVLSIAIFVDFPISYSGLTDTHC